MTTLYSPRIAVITSTLVALTLSALPAGAAEVVVVVSAKSPVATLTVEQAAQLFLGKSNSLPGGGAATIIDRAEGSPTRDAFYNKATGKNAAQVKALWSRLVFSGAAQAPATAGNAAEVKKLLGSNPSAVGYLDSSELDSSVKVVLKLD